MEKYYDPKQWLVPSNTPLDRQIRKANPQLGYINENVIPVSEHDCMIPSGDVVPLPAIPWGTQNNTSTPVMLDPHNWRRRARVPPGVGENGDRDLEAESLVRKHKMICAQNENMKQFNMFTQQIGRTRAAYYRGLTHKGMGGAHDRPVPGHPTIIKPNMTSSPSEDELILKRLMAKSVGSGVITCFVPKQKRKHTNHLSYLRANTDIQTLDYDKHHHHVEGYEHAMKPRYRKQHAHLLLGGTSDSVPTTAPNKERITTFT